MRHSGAGSYRIFQTFFISYSGGIGDSIQGTYSSEYSMFEKRNKRSGVMLMGAFLGIV